MSNNEELKGLSGWLILVGIGVALGPVRLFATTFPVFQAIFVDGTWEALTTVGSESYNPLWAPILIGEIAYNVAMFAALIYLAFLFFTKNYLFPSAYILIVLSSLIFIPLDAWLIQFVMPDEPIWDPETSKEFFRVLIGAMIWVPYMLLSKRVKATFVEKMPNKSSQQGASNAGISA